MDEQQQQVYKFPTEVIDLPSGGKLYGKDSPLYGGKIELKYMTAKEEDILTSQNLIKKGLVIEKLLNSLIMTPGVHIDDLFLGDKNAVMVASRILGYGPEYICEVTHPRTYDKKEYTFNLADCPFNELPEDVDYTKNEFEFNLPLAKTKITWKILNGHDENLIDDEIKKTSKLTKDVKPELTTRLKHVITSINGDTDTKNIYSFVDNLLSRDSILLRNEIQRVTPDINLKQEIEFEEGDSVTVNIPMTVGFFWPKS